MTEVVLFHVLAATAGAAFGLLAIWAGVGRHHWSLRFIPVVAVIVALFPVPAFDLALVFVSQALVVAVPLILVRRFTAPPTDGTANVTPPASHPWRRFSVADLFRATLLIAAVFGVAAYLPADIRASWWKYVLLGGGFGMATLAGTWTALAHRTWWIRLAVVCVAAPLAGVPTAFDGRTYSSFRESQWPWCAVTATVGVLTSVWLLLARAAGLADCHVTTRNSTNGVRTAEAVAVFRRHVARTSLVIVSLAILSLPTMAYYAMLHPAPIPTDALPEPNAFDDLLRITAALQSVGTPERRRMLFDEVHSALGRDIAVPVRYEPNNQGLAEIQTLRQLARNLLADGDWCCLTGNTIDAQQRYLDLVELGLASSQGGLDIHRPFGIAITGMGIEGLRKLRDVLTPDQRRALITILQAHETRWEPLAELERRSLAWWHQQGWSERISFVNPLVNMGQATGQFDDKRSATLRLLICELALSQYIADHGAPPAQLAELVPEYLPDVPNDPFSGRPLVYRTDSTGYVLYSVGQNCLDDGGKRGTSFGDGDMFLDPVPPPASDGAAED